MNLKKTYLNIIKKSFDCDGNDLFNELKSYMIPQRSFLNLCTLINETIKSVELTPVPDEVLIECYTNLKTISNGCYKISYEKIIEIVENSTYMLSDTFTNSLKKYANDITGNLFIIRTEIDESADYYNNKTFLKINSIINDEERSFEFLASLLNNRNSNGLTIIKRNIDIEEYKDCLIFIKESNENFKDTVEHEFTHFIRRICKYDKSLPKTFEHKINPSTSQKYFSIINKAFTSISNEQKYMLYQFITDKLNNEDEQHQTIKSMIKFFIRRYEKDNKKYEVNHKLLSINQIESLEITLKSKFRKNWIETLLNRINSYEIFESENLKNYLNELKKSWEYEIRNIVQTNDVILEEFSLLYLIVKNDFKEYDIDRLIYDEFKKFKFRDF